MAAAYAPSIFTDSEATIARMCIEMMAQKRKTNAGQEEWISTPGTMTFENAQQFANEGAVVVGYSYNIHLRVHEDVPR